MFYWIYDYPMLYSGAVFALVPVAVTLLGILLLAPAMRRWLHADRPANDAIGYTLSSFSVLYGILLGLLAVESYQNFNAANDIVSREATVIGTLYRDFSGYPQPVRQKLQDALYEYAVNVVDESWPMQRKGLLPVNEAPRVSKVFNEMVAFRPTDISHQLLHAEALRQFNSLMEARRARFNNIRTGIPPVLWWVVGVGALVHILLIWMLDIRRHTHLMLGGLLSFYIGVVVFAIAQMDHPFRGEVSDGPEAIKLVVFYMISERK